MPRGELKFGSVAPRIGASFAVAAVSAAKKLQKKSTRHACRHTHSHLGVNVCDDVGVIIMSHVVAESESWPRLVIFDFSYCGDGAGVSCRGMSGGGLSFNEDGTCINESKESFPGVGDGVSMGEVAFSCAGVGCGFFGVASI